MNEAKAGTPIKILLREYDLHENKVLEWIRLMIGLAIGVKKDGPLHFCLCISEKGYFSFPIKTISFKSI